MQIEQFAVGLAHGVVVWGMSDQPAQIDNVPTKTELATDGGGQRIAAFMQRCNRSGIELTLRDECFQLRR